MPLVFLITDTGGINVAKNTKIEWADHTFNPWIGCTKVSPGCDNCYAKAEWDDRRHRAVWGPGQPRSRTKTWGDPVTWNKEPFYECLSCGWRGREKDSKACGDGYDYPHRHCPNCNTTESLSPARARVFCSSLADVFDNEVPPEWRHDLFNLITATPELDWLLLTKRPQNIVRMVQDHGCVAGNGTRYLPRNVWLGTTTEDQKRADINVPALLEARKQTGAKKTFLSMEPLLGPVDLSRIDVNGDFEIYPLKGTTECEDYEGPISDTPALDWVIVGGESGHHARPMHPDWARSLRNQCQAAGVPFLFKQWGEWCPETVMCTREAAKTALYITPEGATRQAAYGARNGATTIQRVGKKAAGRLLDGRTWDEVPA